MSSEEFEPQLLNQTERFLRRLKKTARLKNSKLTNTDAGYNPASQVQTETTADKELPGKEFPAEAGTIEELDEHLFRQINN